MKHLKYYCVNLDFNGYFSGFSRLSTSKSISSAANINDSHEVIPPFFNVKLKLWVRQLP